MIFEIIVLASKWWLHQSIRRDHAENLLKFETIFEYEPNKQKQRSLRKMIEEHEQRVAQRARDLEQARLKETQADQLWKEAESIKQKK